VAITAVMACAPQFQHVGPENLATTAGIERVHLQWSNVYLLHKPGGALLIDSGSPSDREDLEASLRMRGVELQDIKAVVVTHAHADHAGNARWLQAHGAKIVLGVGDVDVAARGENDALHATNLLGALLAPLFMFSFEPFVPDIAVDQPITLAAVGFGEVRVQPAPGHTAGSIIAIAGREAFVGDLVKGGLVGGEHTPSEHIYQTDRIEDHASLHDLLTGTSSNAGDAGEGANDTSATAGTGAAASTSKPAVAVAAASPPPLRLYPGHAGPLDAGETASWLAGAADETGDHAISMSANVLGELPKNGGGANDIGRSIGVRLRAMLGRPLGLSYVFGADLRGGYLDGWLYEADAHPVGLALRSGDGSFLSVTGGIGAGGVRGNGASHWLVEASGELPAGPVRMFVRASLGWTLGGPDYLGDAHGLADEATGMIGVRFGGDKIWGDYHSGHGSYVAFSYRDLGGSEFFGIALGVETFAGK
jgi:glyoxylase-like metal-dependent hydrolase (beta-lactamase superfamily II)